MTTIKEQAKEYKDESLNLVNIGSAGKLSVDLDIKEKEFTKQDGEKFTVEYITVDGTNYQMKKSVIAQLKALIEKYPDMTHFEVIKTGTTKDNTTYLVQKV